MLEIVIPGIRYGEAKINADTAYRGCMCWISGVNADGYHLLSLPYNSAQAAKALYPVNKYYFAEDYNDTADAVDKLKNGDTIVYYEGGEYITDKFDKSSLGLDAGYWANIEGGLTSSYGQKMYVPGSSTAIGTVGLDKLYVATGVGANHKTGYLYGGTPTWTGAGEHFIGFAIGVYYTDSADAKLRYRIHPANTFSSFTSALENF